MIKRVGLLVIMLMIILGTNCWANSKVYDASEVFSNHHDIYLLIKMNTNYQKFSDANDKAYMSGGRLTLKYKDDKDMHPVLKSLGQLSIVYQAINAVWQQSNNSTRTDMPKDNVIWEAFPRLHSLKRNFWGNYDTKEVIMTIISYIPEREDTVIKELDKLKEDK